MVVDQASADAVPAVVSAEAPSSFAPQGFVFQAPAMLSSFKFDPLTPRSADAFLTPRSVSFSSSFGYLILRKTYMLCCCESFNPAPASRFHHLQCSTLIVSLNPVNRFPLNHHATRRLAQWLLQLQPAPWKQSMMYRTSGEISFSLSC